MRSAIAAVRMCIRAALLLLIAAGVAVADDATRPYDETADARADVAVALARARAEDKLLLINFGANWCPDCRALAQAMSDDEIAAVIDERFVVVKVDVGNWDKNPQLVQAYGNPIEGGIPAVVVADAVNEILFSTKAGQLATARSQGRDQLMAFFEEIARLGD